VSGQRWRWEPKRKGRGGCSSRRFAPRVGVLAFSVASGGMDLLGAALYLFCVMLRASGGACYHIQG